MIRTRNLIALLASVTLLAGSLTAALSAQAGGDSSALHIMFQGDNADMIYGGDLPAKLVSGVTPGGSGVELDCSASGYRQFAAPADDKAAGFAFWMKAESTGDLSTIAPSINWVNLKELQTYYTIDKNGVFQTKTTAWKFLREDGFEGWVILPRAAYDELSLNGDAQLTIQNDRGENGHGGKVWFESFGYYTDLEALKAELLAPYQPPVGDEPLNLLMERADQALVESGGGPLAASITDTTPGGAGLRIEAKDGPGDWSVTLPVSGNPAFEGIAMWIDFTTANAGKVAVNIWDRAKDFHGVYHTIDSDSVFQTYTDNSPWKYLAGSAFKGWLILPKAAYKNDGADYTLENGLKLSFILEETGASASVENIGYYTDLEALKESLTDGSGEDEDTGFLLAFKGNNPGALSEKNVDVALAERRSPSGQALAITMGTDKYIRYPAPAAEGTDVKAVAMWVSSGGTTSVTLNDWANVPEENHTYYTIDPSGKLEEKPSTWKYLKLTGFTGWVIVPVSVYNNPLTFGSDSNIIMQFGSGGTLLLESVGYVTDFDKFVENHSAVQTFDLRYALEDAKAAHDAGAAYYKSGWEAFDTAYTAAGGVLAAPADRDAVQEALDTLADTQAALVSRVDKAALQAAADAAKADYEKGAIYFKAGWDDFAAAYEQAVAALADPAASAQKINDAKAALDGAVAALAREYENMVLLRQALAAKGWAKAAYDKGETYYREGWADFAAAYEAAVIVEDKDAPTNAEVDAALSDLQTTQKALRRNAPNQAGAENKGMTILNDGTNLELGNGYCSNAVITADDTAPDGVGMKVTISTFPTEFNFEAFYPEDFDKSKSEGVLLWTKGPVGGEHPAYLWAHNAGSKHYRTAPGAYYYTVDTDGKLERRETSANGTLDLSGFEGWLFVPASSIEYCWGGETTAFETFDISLMESVGFSIATSNLAVQPVMLVDDIGVYTDLKGVLADMGIDYDAIFGGDEPEVPEDTQKGKAAQTAYEGWTVTGGSYDSSYGCVTGLTNGSTVKVSGVMLGDGTNGKVTVNFRASSGGKLLVYAVDADGVKKLAATLTIEDATFLAEDFTAQLGTRLAGTYDLLFELTGGLEGDMYSFAFDGTYSGSAENDNPPDTGVALPLAALALTAGAGLILCAARRRRK